MKKLLSLQALAIACVLAFATSAYAANEYTITFSTNPTKSGTTKKPAPISGKFGFNVRDTQGRRPAALDRLTVSFTGIRMNTRQFTGCSASRIEAAQSDRVCSSRALVATGFANNIAGNIADRNDQSIRCGLTVRLYNSGSGKMVLFVKGGPNEARPCPIQLATAIPVSIVRRSTGDRLSFSIPQNLKNPLATLRNSLVETQLTLLRKTVRKSGRTVGFFETVGNCRAGRRTVTAQFDNEGTDSDTSQSGFARCRS
jgi:hypothetical protein